MLSIPFYALDKPGEKGVVLGNEGLARGVLEAGVRVASAYPGTPSSEIMETLAIMHKYHPIFDIEWSTNEAVGFQVALGASMCNARAFACMKHVGLNVAADGFMTATYAGAHGGFVTLSADDPNCYSSQNEQDNRYYGLHSLCPVFEAINIQEAKDVIKYGFDFSEEHQTIVMMRTTTRLNHARGDLKLGKINRIENRTYDFDKDRERWTFLPTNARVQRVKQLERYEKLRKLSNKFPFTELKINDGSKIGIISSGIPYSYVNDALLKLDQFNKVSILKLGMVFPQPERLMEKLFDHCEKVIVVEELEPFQEDFAKKLAYELDSSVEIVGKQYFPRNGELDLGKTVKGMVKALNMVNPIVDIAVDTKNFHKASPRPPVLCPGCSHRNTFYALKLMEKRLGKSFVYSSDIGCYTLGFYKPIEAIDTCICMGGSIGMANGIAKLHSDPVLALIGDSTFFHTGIPGLVNAVYNQNNVNVIILDNSATAMTGFQPHPGTGEKITGEPGTKIPIEQIVKGSGITDDHLWIVDSNDLNQTTKAIEEAVNTKGPNVIISRHICTLLERRINKGKKIIPVEIDYDKCNNCMICIKNFGCPAITVKEEKVTIIERQCRGCDVCIEICPFEAIHKKNGNSQ
ncbi:MAG: indolepyruvate ferredoxin oxidoreductase subunit alpha [Candidatus Lokiarchaeota archaeon]|nr:indolepyruvate ferredoxin oxidoreductase subunit alpha [Candidatus Lokiarchaeota archaeon]MBD3342791.1 indolepyruvate ferredoxin oxidoreductase subunit alpha [Candidatus Lokiarchaeota archaeon]